MNPTEDNFPTTTGFDMSRGCSVKRQVFVLTYNGFPIGQHVRREDAEKTADRLCARVPTSRKCFETREVWR